MGAGDHTGFEQLDAFPLAAPWHANGEGGYALVMRGVKPGAGPSPLALEPKREDLSAPLGLMGWLRFAARFVVGSVAGAAFVPVGLVLRVRSRL